MRNFGFKSQRTKFFFLDIFRKKSSCLKHAVFAGETLGQHHLVGDVADVAADVEATVAGAVAQQVPAQARLVGVAALAVQAAHAELEPAEVVGGDLDAHVDGLALRVPAHNEPGVLGPAAAELARTRPVLAARRAAAAVLVVLHVEAAAVHLRVRVLGDALARELTPAARARRRVEQATVRVHARHAARHQQQTRIVKHFFRF